jgi:hypothetical protein
LQRSPNRPARLLLISVAALAVLLFALSRFFRQPAPPPVDPTWWRIQSVDAMKYSRDVSREKLTDLGFDRIIRQQVDAIAATGATHVAVGTPYDDEFVPFLERWVNIARQAGLNVWFRGNQSGWEEWFDYPLMTAEEHRAATDRFIRMHGRLFENGDVFDPCPECENGALGDPRQTGELTAYRDFLTATYRTSREAFRQINRNVMTVFSMNYDVASLVMDASTTAALGGNVAIDHYVASPDRLQEDIRRLAAASHGRILLAEFGAPIPDIHGPLTPEAQADWVGAALRRLAETPELTGLNYWVSFGGTTALWQDDATPHPAVDVLSAYYDPVFLQGRVRHPLFGAVEGATVHYESRSVRTDDDGFFHLPYRPGDPILLRVEAAGYQPQTVLVEAPEALIDVRMRRD